MLCKQLPLTKGLGSLFGFDTGAEEDTSGILDKKCMPKTGRGLGNHRVKDIKVAYLMKFAFPLYAKLVGALGAECSITGVEVGVALGRPSTGSPYQSASIFACSNCQDGGANLLEIDTSRVGRVSLNSDGSVNLKTG
ncbi:hypothetical protein LINPERHAP2_LOCUS10457 [Linum perenne]